MYRRVAVLLAIIVGLVALWPAAPTSAHERRQVGNYILVVGFATEPTFLEELNGVSITVFTRDGKAVENVQRTLKVEVRTGDARKTFDLAADRTRQGAYRADFIPTKTGSYIFQFTGKIEDTDINETFESGPNRFDEVVTKASMQFPSPVPSNGELAAQLQRTAGAAPTPAGAAGATVTPSSAGAGAGASTAAPVDTAATQKALDRATSARNLALAIGGAGLLIGLLGLAAAGYAIASRGDRPPGRSQEPV